MMNRAIKENREVGLIVRRHESLKVITLIEAVVAMVPVIIATMFNYTGKSVKRRRFLV